LHFIAFDGLSFVGWSGIWWERALVVVTYRRYCRAHTLMAIETTHFQVRDVTFVFWQ